MYLCLYIVYCYYRKYFYLNIWHNLFSITLKFKITGNSGNSISMSLNENEVSVSSTKHTYINRDLELPEKNHLEPINELRQIRQKY